MVKTLYIRPQDDDVWRELERRAEGENVSVSYLVAQAIRKFLAADPE